MDWKLEVVVVPVSDVDRAKRFYSEQVGFVVDVDHRATETMRVVQLTPPGSGCSITIGTGLIESAPGSLRGPRLVVTPRYRNRRLTRIADPSLLPPRSHASRDGVCHSVLSDVQTLGAPDPGGQPATRHVPGGASPHSC